VGRVDKGRIIQDAQSDPLSVRRWLADREQTADATPYDLTRDRLGRYQWQSLTRQYAQDHPLTIAPVHTQQEFEQVVGAIINQYRHYVEEERGWRLLWENPGPGKENAKESAHLVLRGLATAYCVANDISLDREVEVGRGPVDFKFSRGYSLKAHLEIKKLHNGKFWHGPNTQLPTYLRADQTQLGWFVALMYRDPARTMKDRLVEVPALLQKLGSERGVTLRFLLIDARPKLSASKLWRATKPVHMAEKRFFGHSRG
jgi:hypothetical protein